MSQDYPNVRGSHTCVKCDGFKEQELLLCWSCHHAETRLYGGSYSEAVEKKLAAAELRERAVTVRPPMYLDDVCKCHGLFAASCPDNRDYK
jgi:ribosomal protein L37AE/L43A